MNSFNVAQKKIVFFNDLFHFTKITELDLSQPKEQSLDIDLSDFVLDKIDWKKGLESWNRVFVSKYFKQTCDYYNVFVFVKNFRNFLTNQKTWLTKQKG